MMHPVRIEKPIRGQKISLMIEGDSALLIFLLTGMANN